MSIYVDPLFYAKVTAAANEHENCPLESGENY